MDILFVINEFCLVLIFFSFIEILFRKAYTLKVSLYLISSLILSILYVSILMYYTYYGAIPTFSAFKQIGQVGALTDSIVSLLQPNYLLFLIDFPILIAILIKNKEMTSRNVSKKVSLILGLASITVLTTSYTLQMKNEAINEIKMAQHLGVINNSIYLSLPISADQDEEQDTVISQEHINQIKEINPNQQAQLFGEAKGKNIIMVQLEAFQNFPIGKEIADQEITPTINELIKTSYYFPNIFQQIGKGNTSDAEFMVNTSIYPVGDRAMSQEYSEKSIPSLPKILKEHGYQSLTYHTNDVEFWNRNEMYQALGFDRVYEKSFFGTEDVISFGASDEVLYSKTLSTLEKLHQEGEPFYAHVISMSSHHPFKIPANKPQLNLPNDFENTSVKDYLQAIYYADFALGEFIRGLKDKGIWEDTLFVIYGDHYGLQLKTDQDKDLVNEMLGREYHQHLDGFNIPLIIFNPERSKGIEIQTVGGQIDIMPTITLLLGIPIDQIHFGQDLINYPNNVVGNRFYLPTGTFFNNDILFIPGESFQDGKAISLETNQPLSEFQPYFSDFERVMSLMSLSDQYVNSLPLRK
ncbi:LTA synthase family protein [Niallia sp. XMNu-256]|uniref:LTA synthase family protein n=1 Tax=Niallia sp. XMNu-256 TaxID=3082444 RepID=UPI0030D171EE